MGSKLGKNNIVDAKESESLPENNPQTQEEPKESKEEELKRMMIYLGRPGLHSDWVRFQVEARKRRQQAEKDRAQKIAKLQEDLLTYFLIFLGIGVGVAVLVLGVMFYQRSS